MNLGNICINTISKIKCQTHAYGFKKKHLIFFLLFMIFHDNVIKAM
jgi:hypothetical protein